MQTGKLKLLAVAAVMALGLGVAACGGGGAAVDTAQGGTDTAQGGTDTAQGGTDTATRRTNQMTALMDASTALQTALSALVGATPTQAQLDAANNALAALNMAIADGADLTDAEKAPYQHEADNAAAPIMTAQMAFEEAGDEADKAAAAAMAVTAKKLYDGIAPPTFEPEVENDPNRRFAQIGVISDVVITASGTDATGRQANTRETRRRRSRTITVGKAGDLLIPCQAQRPAAWATCGRPSSTRTLASRRKGTSSASPASHLRQRGTNTA